MYNLPSIIHYNRNLPCNKVFSFLCVPPLLQAAPALLPLSSGIPQPPPLLTKLGCMLSRLGRRLKIALKHPTLIC
jgi:hypothetical protein